MHMYAETLLAGVIIGLVLGGVATLAALKISGAL